MVSVFYDVAIEGNLVDIAHILRPCAALLSSEQIFEPLFQHIFWRMYATYHQLDLLSCIHPVFIFVATCDMCVRTE